MRYLSHDIAKCFSSSEKRETVLLSDNAKYERLISLLEEKYEKVTKQPQSSRLKAKMLDIFIFLCDGKPLTTIKDRLINPDNEVYVAYADLGG